MTGDPRVKQIYQENLKKGMSPKDAAKDAQARTGVSAVTGRPFKRTHRSYEEIGEIKGQYD